MAGEGNPASNRRHPLLASLLSFFVPGLGQLLSGRVARGVAFGIPFLLLVAGVAAAVIFDRHALVRAALSPVALLWIVVLSLILLAYRLWAIIDAYLVASTPGAPTPPGGGTLRALSLVGLGAILLVTLAMHGWVAYLGLSARDTLVAMFDPSGPRGLASASTATTPSATVSPSGSAAPATPTLVPTPTATPLPQWAEDGRLNVLLIGSDAGPGRWSMRADAIVLVSIQIQSGRVAAFSVPRYTRNVPLPEPEASAFGCRCLSEDYFNALYVYANTHPDLFPGSDEVSRGLGALSGAAEQLFGVQLDGMVVADLNGFVDLVDAIGGLTIDIPEPIYDAAYPNPDGSGTLILQMNAGLQHLDGWHALAYARTRHQDGDVGRMYRQQLVIRSLKQQIGCDLLGKLPAILRVARDTLWTSLPLDDVPEMVGIDIGPVESHVEFDTYNVTLTPADVARVSADVAHAFDGPAPPPDPEIPC